MIINPNKITKTQITTAAKAAVVQTADTQTEAWADTPEQRARIKQVIMGVDLHKRDCKVTTILSGSKAQPAQIILTERMVEWVRRQRERYPNARFHIGYEAGPCGYWLQRELAKLPNVECIVIAPEPLNGPRKTDKRDSRSLAVKLRHYHAEGDPRALSRVRVPTLDEEQQRSVLRHRRALLKTYGQQVLRCRSAALLHGCELKGKFWKGDAWEKTLPAKLPPKIRANIASWRVVILAIVAQLAACNEQIETMAAKEAPAPYGVGAITALTLKLEVGDWHRFSGRRAVASYTGLCPGEHSSGQHRVELSIDKIGNRTVRHTLIETAWRMKLHQPDYPPIVKFLDKAKGARNRRRAIVAVARQLAVDLWRLNTGGASAQEMGLSYERPAPRTEPKTTPAPKPAKPARAQTPRQTPPGAPPPANARTASKHRQSPRNRDDRRVH